MVLLQCYHRWWMETPERIATNPWCGRIFWQRIFTLLLTPPLSSLPLCITFIRFFLLQIFSHWLFQSYSFASIQSGLTWQATNRMERDGDSSSTHYQLSWRKNQHLYLDFYHSSLKKRYFIWNKRNDSCLFLNVLWTNLWNWTQWIGFFCKKG